MKTFAYWSVLDSYYVCSKDEVKEQFEKSRYFTMHFWFAFE